MNNRIFSWLCAVMLGCACLPSLAHQYTWDPDCDCWIPDTSGPSIPDEDDPADTFSGPDPEPSKFTLLQTGGNAGNRGISAVVTFDHHQPDGVVETREFQYSTPKNFKNRAHDSVNLWLVFHGKNGNSSSMHGKYFKVIPHDAPTVMVYPEALRVTYQNQVTTDTDEQSMWRGHQTPGDGAEPNAFRDVTFVERLVGRLLINNPQLNGNKVYVSGFSSGASMTWMLLCYRSAMFAGFAVYSHELGLIRETEGCGDGELSGLTDNRTGYERLTGVEPDRYGPNGNPPAMLLSPTKPVLYIHGTLDDNLIFGPTAGCWAGRPPLAANECALNEDPLFSMDYGGPLEDRDDKSSVLWLLSRHLLPNEPASVCTVLDADRSNSDSVVTFRYEYRSASAIALGSHEPVTWYEMKGADHNVSTLDQPTVGLNSTDFEASLHTQSFFETVAGMLKTTAASRFASDFLCSSSARSRSPRAR